MATHNDLGRQGEQIAAEYLERQGYHILHRNWRLGHRDLDIVTLDEEAQVLAIVEVKSRRDTVFAQPEEAVNWQKVRNLTIAAQAYVRRYNIACEIRFDIVTVTGTQPPYEVRHIKNAFPVPLF